MLWRVGLFEYDEKSQTMVRKHWVTPPIPFDSAQWLMHKLNLAFGYGKGSSRKFLTDR